MGIMLHLFTAIAFNLEKGSKRHFYDVSDFNTGSSKVLWFFLACMNGSESLNASHQFTVTIFYLILIYNFSLFTINIFLK